MTKIVINIEGMSCGHCTSAVENALKRTDGVENVKVSLDDKNAVVEFDESIVSAEALADVVEDQGFEANL